MARIILSHAMGYSSKKLGLLNHQSMKNPREFLASIIVTRNASLLY